MTNRVFHQLLVLDQTPSFTAAIRRLFRESCYAPVVDFESYNSSPGISSNRKVTEFLLACEILSPGVEGSICFSLATPETRMDCRFDLNHRKILLEDGFSGKVLRTGDIPTRTNLRKFAIEFSTIDRQVCLAVDGVEPITPWLLPEKLPDTPMPIEQAAIEVEQGDFEICHLNLFRDIYYTRRHARHAVEDEFELGPDEYFVLGDNSSVSSDSRMWDRAAVPEKLLVGKPFVVHLPSRTTTIGDSKSGWQIRLPDFSRMRFVR